MNKYFEELKVKLTDNPYNVQSTQILINGLAAMIDSAVERTVNKAVDRSLLTEFTTLAVDLRTSDGELALAVNENTKVWATNPDRTVTFPDGSVRQVDGSIAYPARDKTTGAIIPPEVTNPSLVEARVNEPGFYEDHIGEDDTNAAEGDRAAKRRR